jgi:1,2-phenylacetyl-CoA epoxidase catalytic subunit
MLSRAMIRRLMPFVVAFGVFWLGVASDRLLKSWSSNSIFLFADDFIIAAVLGLIVMLYERRRERYLEARLRVVREMNHHVRNALQVLSYTAMQHGDEKVRKMMNESVARIDWALREVLPSDDATA